MSHLNKKDTSIFDEVESRKYFSENGEDGIIEKILEIISSANRLNKWCVELGAWDGIKGSNTRYFITNKGYSAVLIEGDKKRFKDLKKNYLQYKNVICINAFVGFKPEDCLDQILQNIPELPIDFDFLSIDVDGNDYHIWKATSKYRPKVVCIEYNPTIPNEVDFCQPPSMSLNQGSSLLALVNLGKEKGYELVHALEYNAFFVRKEFFPLFGISDNSIAAMRTKYNYITYIFFGYDGTLFLRGYRKLAWHYGIPIREFQILPRFLRKYPGSWSMGRKLLFGIWLFFHNPKLLFSKLKEKLLNCKKTTEKDGKIY